MSLTRAARGLLAGLLMAAAVLLGGSTGVLGLCGPFTDVSDVVFCPFVLEIFYLGITTGTTATTYDPASNVTRLQMAAFLSRTVDGLLKRGSRRAALDRFSGSSGSAALGLTTIGVFPFYVASDGADLWAPGVGSVWRVRASDGKLLETWTASGPTGVRVAMGRVFVSGVDKLYSIDPAQPAGLVTTVASLPLSNAGAVAFDGARLFVIHRLPTPAVSIVTPGPTIPWTATTVTEASVQDPFGLAYDGSNMWMTDYQGGTVNKLNSVGAILQTITVSNPVTPGYDGANLFVPTGVATVVVIRPSTGLILTTLTGNGLNAGGRGFAFDGERILVTNFFGDSVSIWKAADLTPLGYFSTGGGSGPQGACSDGVSFWITLFNGGGNGKLARL